MTLDTGDACWVLEECKFRICSKFGGRNFGEDKRI